MREISPEAKINRRKFLGGMMAAGAAAAGVSENSYAHTVSERDQHNPYAQVNGITRVEGVDNREIFADLNIAVKTYKAYIESSGKGSNFKYYTPRASGKESKYANDGIKSGAKWETGKTMDGKDFIFAIDRKAGEQLTHLPYNMIAEAQIVGGIGIVVLKKGTPVIVKEFIDPRATQDAKLGIQYIASCRNYISKTLFVCGEEEFEEAKRANPNCTFEDVQAAKRGGKKG